ncbi:lasso peptide biosynthesis B2 protein [Streptomyces sp. NPDC048483]|uniref:lasso peptide biosynthesis B2 protein n=1 Tax=Streptomyces sp. NPDC048483 TaxID=3154927 RepID=UPI0034253335
MVPLPAAPVLVPACACPDRYGRRPAVRRTQAAPLPPCPVRSGARGRSRHDLSGARRTRGRRGAGRALRREGCLRRSVATALLCRMRGVWPHWCTGVRTAPFRAHAWVEVEGLAVGGPYWLGEYRRMVVVPVCRKRGCQKSSPEAGGPAVANWRSVTGPGRAGRARRRARGAFCPDASSVSGRGLGRAVWKGSSSPAGAELTDGWPGEPEA